jgi:hypothetical protein
LICWDADSDPRQLAKVETKDKGEQLSRWTAQTLSSVFEAKTWRSICVEHDGKTSESMRDNERDVCLVVRGKKD